MSPDDKFGALADQLAAEIARDADVGAKYDDPPDEQRRRSAALGMFRAAMDVEDLAERAAAERTAVAASRAAWLGASLADLSAVTGRSRQAARKRWPGLGDIHRRRKWLGDHVEDIAHIAGLLDEHGADLLPTGGGAEQPGEQLASLRTSARRCEEEFAEPRSDPGADADPAARWRELDRLVDVLMRGVVDGAGEPATDQAGFALHAARGLVGYYDHASAV